MTQCHYCARSGVENKLEYIPHKKEYYCKRCEYHFSEDSINDMLPKVETEINSEIKAGGFPLTVVKEDSVPKQVKEIYKTSIKKTKSSGKGKDILSDDS